MNQFKTVLANSFTLGKFWPKTTIQKICLNDQETAHPLAVIGGTVTEYKEARNNFEDKEPSKVFSGKFNAVLEIPTPQGEVITYSVVSGRAYLPTIAAELVAGQLDAGGPGGCVMFKFLISAKFSESSATGYVFEVTPLVEPTETEAAARAELLNDLRAARGAQNLIGAE